MNVAPAHSRTITDATLAEGSARGFARFRAVVLDAGGPALALLRDGRLGTGDPTEDITILQGKANLAAIMKDGRLHKRPAAAQH